MNNFVFSGFIKQAINRGLTQEHAETLLKQARWALGQSGSNFGGLLSFLSNRGTQSTNFGPLKGSFVSFNKTNNGPWGNRIWGNQVGRGATPYRMASIANPNSPYSRPFAPRAQSNPNVFSGNKLNVKNINVNKGPLGNTAIGTSPYLVGHAVASSGPVNLSKSVMAGTGMPTLSGKETRIS